MQQPQQPLPQQPLQQQLAQMQAMQYEQAQAQAQSQLMPSFGAASSAFSPFAPGFGLAPAPAGRVARVRAMLRAPLGEAPAALDAQAHASAYAQAAMSAPATVPAPATATAASPFPFLPMDAVAAFAAALATALLQAAAAGAHVGAAGAPTTPMLALAPAQALAPAPALGSRTQARTFARAVAPAPAPEPSAAAAPARGRTPAATAAAAAAVASAFGAAARPPPEAPAPRALTHWLATQGSVHSLKELLAKYAASVTALCEARACALIVKRLAGKPDATARDRAAATTHFATLAKSWLRRSAEEPGRRGRSTGRMLAAAAELRVGDMLLVGALAAEAAQASAGFDGPHATSALGAAALLGVADAGAVAKLVAAVVRTAAQPQPQPQPPAARGRVRPFKASDAAACVWAAAALGVSAKSDIWQLLRAIVAAAYDAPAAAAAPAPAPAVAEFVAPSASSPAPMPPVGEARMLLQAHLLLEAAAEAPTAGAAAQGASAASAEPAPAPPLLSTALRARCEEACKAAVAAAGVPRSAHKGTPLGDLANALSRHGLRTEGYGVALLGGAVCADFLASAPGIGLPGGGAAEGAAAGTPGAPAPRLEVAVFLEGPERVLGGDAAPHRAAQHPRPRPDGRTALRDRLLATARGGVSVLSVPLVNWLRLSGQPTWQDEWWVQCARGSACTREVAAAAPALRPR